MNSSAYLDGDAVLLRANASDEDGSISKVEFYVNNALMGSDAVAPYSLNWNAVVGSHTVSAKAFDDKGATIDSSAFVIEVSPVAQNQLPQVSLTSPVMVLNISRESSLH